MKTILEVLQGDCRYALNRKRGGMTLFCAATCTPGRSFCDRHHAICYRQVETPIAVRHRDSIPAPAKTKFEIKGVDEHLEKREKLRFEGV